MARQRGRRKRTVRQAAEPARTAGKSLLPVQAGPVARSQSTLGALGIGPSTWTCHACEAFCAQLPWWLREQCLVACRPICGTY